MSDSYKMFRTVPNTREMMNKFWLSLLLSSCVLLTKYTKLLKESYDFCGENSLHLYYSFSNY